ncbi:DUF4257 domain-containing protein, partial [Bacillus sp. JJ1521]|uniref:DUF4257 domain-containing protein n=1 Tax=Bacillus sp. JJ1521 TaxID=3122957 RepID=UPI0030007C20
IGTVAAVLVVASSDTESIFRVVFLSILAGYGGERIMQRVDFARQAKTSNELRSETNQEQENNKTNDAL